jgi:hypothetical protein
MQATPRRCAAVARFALRAAFFASLLMLVACSSRTTKNQIVPPTPTSGDVALTLSEATYTSHQPIGVMVSNKSKTSYFAKTGLSACTYLQLEFYDTTKKAWIAVDGCTAAQTPHMLLLSPASSLPFTLAPGDSSNDPNAWLPGVYRVSLRYGTASDGSGNSTVVYSTGFKVSS